MTTPKPEATGRGYASGFVAQVEASDQTLPGVQLGLLCIKHNIPIAWVAAQMGVSRQTIYNWFSGTVPQGHRQAKVEKLLTHLRNRLS